MLVPAIAASAAESPPAEIVQLSPFEVVGDNQGYHASNLLSGTRLNARLEDVAASISVVTKQQMQDFGLLDLNDVFLYEANTEGTGNYTDATIDRFGNANDNVEGNPQGANRIRGIGPANTAVGNFATSGRVPLDPINVDAVEISRGPNSNIFGLGNAAGTVNFVPATANLSRNFAQIGFRADSYEGYRGSVDLNRVLLKGRLALRGSFVDQHDAFVRKPSGTDTRRLNAMMKYQPFKFTTVRASFEHYHLDGTRANTITPRDGVTYWQQSGSPSWDPVTFTAHRGGATVGTFSGTAGLPNYFQTMPFVARPSLFIDRSGTGLWMVNQTTNTNNPSTNNQAIRFLESAPQPIRTNQPLFSTVMPVTSKAIYDWTDVNLASINAINDTVDTSTVELDQVFVSTGRHLLAAQAGWRREDTERYNRRTLGSESAFTGGSYLYVDVNERLLDGSPNPYFGRPYLGIGEPLRQHEPLRTDIYRLQLAYKLDFAREKSRLRWLGTHQVAAYGEYKDTVRRRFQFRDAVLSNHAWLPAGTARANLNIAPISPVAARNYDRFYVGDAAGQNVDYAPTAFQPGDYTFNWFNGVTRQWVKEPATIGAAATLDGSGGNFNLHNVLKSRGIVLQSHLFNDRLVTTLGLRDDRTYDMFGATPRLAANGYDFDYAAMNAWSGNWTSNRGRTKTAGVVLKPLRWLHLHANKSDSFLPAAPAQTILRQPVPNPTGEGKDYGFTLHFFDDKLVLRANQYTTKQINSRDGFGVGAIRVLRTDFDAIQNDNFSLSRQATAWIQADAAARGVTLSSAQLQAAVAQTMGLTTEDLAQFQSTPFAETSDLTAKGREIEVNYNPNSFWTAKLNVAQQETVDSNLSPNLDRWLAQRMPIWEKIIDPRTGTPWFTTGYPTQTPSAFLQSAVIAPLRLAQATEGKSRPQVRKYRANFATNYRLAGLTDHSVLKRFNVGGALRWEDKAAIGFYGVQQFPASITELDSARPIYDRARLYVDAFVGYSARLFGNKIGARFQLNVRNLTEDGGRLQAVGAFPNGQPSTFRIIDPRMFVVSATFDL